MNKEQRVALYARTSTANSRQDPAMQIRELRDYCKRRGWRIFDEYVDRGISGAKDSRPQLNKLMTDAHRRRFDVVAVWDFSRFARSTAHLLRALETFSELKIAFVSLREQIDTGTATGKMIFTILGSVAELERSLIGDRVRAGLRNAKAKGKRLGRPPLRELSTADIRQLRRDRRHGVSFKQLARDHGISVWTAFEKCKKAS